MLQTTLTPNGISGILVMLALEEIARVGWLSPGRQPPHPNIYPRVDLSDQQEA